MQARLVPEIKHITVIEHDVATLEELKELKGELGLPKKQSQERDHLYVIRLKKAKENAKLFLAPEWPTEYQELVQARKSHNLISIKDDKELLQCQANQKYDLPGDEDESPSISAKSFTEYGDLVERHCQQETQKHSPVYQLEGRDRGRYGQGASGGDYGSFGHDDDHHHQADTPEPLFSTQEEKQITTFFGSDLVDSVKKLQAVFDKKAEADNKARRNHVEEPGEQELMTLIQTLKDQTPNRAMDKQAASENEGVRAIAEAAKALEGKLKLTKWWQKAGKWILRIVGAIAAAAPGAYYGAKWGAAAGAAIGGGVASVPAATIGAVGGGLIGGGLGLWGGHKAGKWLSHRSSTIAKADHSTTIDEAVTSRMARKR